MKTNQRPSNKPIFKSSIPIIIVVCFVGILILRQLKISSVQKAENISTGKTSNPKFVDNKDPNLDRDLSNKQTWILTPNGVNPVGPQRGTTQINKIEVPVGEEAKKEARDQNQFARNHAGILKPEFGKYGAIIVYESGTDPITNTSSAIILDGGSQSKKQNQFAQLYGSAMKRAQKRPSLQVFVQYVAPLNADVPGTGTTQPVDNPSGPKDLSFGTDKRAKRPLIVTDPDSGDIWMDKAFKINEGDKARLSLQKLFASPALQMNGALDEADKDFLVQFKDGRGKIVAHQTIGDIQGKVIEWRDPKAENLYKNWWK